MFVKHDTVCHSILISACYLVWKQLRVKLVVVWECLLLCIVYIFISFISMHSSLFVRICYISGNDFRMFCCLYNIVCCHALHFFQRCFQSVLSTCMMYALTECFLPYSILSLVFALQYFVTSYTVFCCCH